MSLKLLAEDDRPREKFLSKGKDSLSNAELLSIILKMGYKETSAVELAREILNSVDNNWNNLAKLTPKELTKFKGIGDVKAVEILAALEIGRRRAAQEVVEKTQINSSKAAFEFLKPYMADLQKEEFWVIFVNRNNRVLHFSKFFSGGITFSVVDVRLIYKTALEQFATGIFVAHNHPSGNLQPSMEDKKITSQLVEGGKILNIEIIDHLILSQNSYFSFADEGML